MMKADLLIKSNAIFDSIREMPFSGFVAMRGNRIIGVGPEDMAEKYIDRKTKIYKYDDKLVMAGFNDSHTHLLLAGMYGSNVNLGKTKSEEEAVKLLADHYRNRDKTGWLFGFNWYHVYWEKKELPTKRSLDPYFHENPVFLLNAEAHGAWVNSKALEICGITKETKDPKGGRIARFENGEPTGFFYEAAVGLVSKYAYSFTQEQEKVFLLNYMKNAAEYGITSTMDVRPYFTSDLGSLEVYHDLDVEDVLTVRIHTAGNLLGNLDEAEEDRRKYNSARLKTNYLKQFVDGVIITHTALLTEDYEGCQGDKGTSLNDLEVIRKGIMEAHSRGFYIKLHAIGDRAVKFCLDAFEEAHATYGDTGSRHMIEHLELVDEADYGRFEHFKVIPSMQPEHLGLMPTWEGEEYRKALGEKRAGNTWPTKTLLDISGTLAIGSDCPVVDNNPFYEIYRAVTRVHDDGLPEGGWNPAEKLTMAEMLKCYTYGSAYGEGREEELGTLAEGMLADVIVIDRNLFDTDVEQIRKSKVELTVMDGKVIFDRCGEGGNDDV